MKRTNTQKLERDAIKQNGILPNNARRKRVGLTTQIRKQQRQATISKRRNPAAVKSHEKADKTWRLLTKNLEAFMRYLNSDDSRKQIQSAHMFRLVLSKKENPPIDEILGFGCIKRIIELLDDPGRNIALQMELLWILCNIAVGTTAHVKFLLDLNALPRILSRVASDHPSLRSQALWTLANIAGDCPEIRDEVLRAGVIPHLKKIFSSIEDVDTKRQLAWLVLNLVRGKPSPDWAYVGELVGLLESLITVEDIEALKDVAWAFSFVTDRNGPPLRALVSKSTLVGQAINLIRTVDDEDLIFTLMRGVVNVLAGDEQVVEAVIGKGILGVVHACLGHTSEKVRKQAMWALSNVMVGPLRHITAVFSHNMMLPAINLLKSDALSVRCEAVWCVSNCLQRASVEQFWCILQYGAIEGLCQFITNTSSDPKAVLESLKALEKLLQFGTAQRKPDGDNLVALAIEELNGLEALEKLQYHTIEDIFHLSQHIIEKYFDGEEDVQFTRMQPEVGSNNQFVFSQPKNPSQGFNFG
mmetsp:Transcript_5722/g.6212  ORF Transcript_5722/g.6212 Transcript_5722/m.6212 type:complete len:528 (+) Transcript_5722:65-1648(+)